MWRRGRKRVRGGGCVVGCRLIECDVSHTTHVTSLARDRNAACWATVWSLANLLMRAGGTNDTGASADEQYTVQCGTFEDVLLRFRRVRRVSIRYGGVARDACRLSSTV